MRTHQSIVGRFDGNLWHFYIEVPHPVASEFISGNHRRVVCTIGNEKFQCALMPDGKGHFFINLNKKLRTKLNIREGDQIAYSLERDESEYGLPMPDELKELLLQDPGGDELFHALTPGKQRTLIYMVTTPKSTDIRIRKSICILEHLKATKGQINYRKLNELFKNAR